jgi:CMP/dCMP kinase
LEQKRVKIIAIDGPAGSGKSTLAQLLAQRLDYTYINTGAIYRAVAYLSQQEKVDEGFEAFIDKVKDDLHWSAGRMYYREEDITDKLHSVAQRASELAAREDVRKALLPLQRHFATRTQKKASILDGRDIGTIVFPDADVKIFLTASLRERARRRQLQLGLDHDITDVEHQIRQRDACDSERSLAPLKQADDAVLVDTTDKSLEQIVAEMITLVDSASL